MKTRFAEKVKELIGKQKEDKEHNIQSSIEYIVSTPSLARTITLIYSYTKETGRKCFSYNSIKSYASKTGFYREYTDRTLDRSIRKLASMGVLYRTKYSKDKRIVFFCPTKIFYAVLRRLMVVENDNSVSNM